MSQKKIKEWAERKWNNTIRGRIKKEGRNKENNFCKKTFLKWFIKEFGNNPKCKYCEIPNEKIENIYWKIRKTKRPKTRIYLEVDRKDPSGDYNESNCVLACFVCNNAKSDIFNCDEFKKIGEQIKQIWKKTNL